MSKLPVQNSGQIGNLIQTLGTKLEHVNSEKELETLFDEGTGENSFGLNLSLNTEEGKSIKEVVISVFNLVKNAVKNAGNAFQNGFQVTSGNLTYNENGQVVSETKEDGSTVSYTYNDNGKLATEIAQ